MTLRAVFTFLFAFVIQCLWITASALAAAPESTLTSINCAQIFDTAEKSDFVTAPPLRKLIQNGFQIMINTSNAIKVADYQNLLGTYDLKFTHQDAAEIESDAVTVVVQKASQFNEANTVVIVEDTSLDVDGADIGVNVRWKISELPHLIGHKATWHVMMAYGHDGKIFVFTGSVHGKIVTPSKTNTIPGFVPYFLPDGATETAELLNQHGDWNPRTAVVANLIAGKALGVFEPINKWNGKWQH